MNQKTFRRRLGALSLAFALILGLLLPELSVAAATQNLTGKGIFMEMLNQMEKVQSLNYIADLDFDAKSSDAFKLSVFGSVDQNEAAARSRLSATILPVVVDGDTLPSRPAIETVVDNTSVYFKASGLPEELLQEELVKKYTNTWIRYNEETIKSIINQIASSTSDIDRVFMEEWFSQYKPSFNDPAHLAAQKEQAHKLREALIKRNVFAITRLKDVRKDKGDTSSPFMYHLSLKINKWNLGLFLKDASAILADNPSFMKVKTQDVWREISRDMISHLAAVRLPTIDILVDKATLMPYQTTISFYNQDAKAKQPIIGTLTITTDGFNAARPIAIPDSFKKLEDILKEAKVFEPHYYYSELPTSTSEVSTSTIISTSTASSTSSTSK